MDRLLQDLRFAAPLLWKDRSFAATTVATLALCLAANVAIFALVDGVLLKPLPFPESDRLVRIFNMYPGAGVEMADNGVPDYFDRQRDLTALQEIANYRQAGVTLSGGAGEAERIQSMLVTPSFFRVLQTEAMRGQLFTEAHGEVGQNKVVVLTHGFWQRVFGGQDAALGQDLRLGGEPYRIIGVLPPGFTFINPEIQLFQPVAFTPQERSDESRHSNSWQQFGRLKPGATIEQVQSQVDALNAANLDIVPALREILINARFGTRVVGFHDHLVAESRSTLTLLWGGAVFVLLIGAVNVANLVLVRSTSRIRELATRHALGATFGRLVRQSLTESVVLATLGGLAGIGLGWWALQAAPYFGFDRLPAGSGIHLDGRVLGFTLLLIAVVGIAVGLIPVVAMRRANMAQAIREEGRGGTQGRAPRLMRRVLVTSQVAFALMLLIGAGVLLASFERVLDVNPGFRPDHVLTGTISLPASRYAGEEPVRALVDRVLERVRALPGVEAAGVTSTIPFSGNTSDSVILAEGYQMQPGESLVSPGQVVASDGYFDAALGRTVAAELDRRAAAGRYREAASPAALAGQLNGDFYELTRDKHIFVAERRPASTGSSGGERRNVPTTAGFRRTEILAGHVGLLDLAFFMRPVEHRDALAAAMRTLHPAEALILDMRDNGGGSPGTVALLISYLLDAPDRPLFEITHRDGSRDVYRTEATPPLTRNGRRPIYVLTSPRSFSGGEGLAFLLQDLKRAVVVGEGTAGAANPGRDPGQSLYAPKA